jgi:glycosyltransferase involved in cell wall biosynthesis
VAVTSVVCLLPARNAERDLPGWLDSAARVADSVVALDDGSTDGTADLLASSPLVKSLLRNPVRDSYRGWDDAANRNRLLSCAADLQPRWVLSLDADERIDQDDAAALREFLERDALPSCAYGMRHYRVWGHELHDPRFTWIYRLFPYRPGQAFPDRRLHFDPVPTSIPRRDWLRTTIRVRHLGAADEARLAERAAKYREAQGSDHACLARAPDAPLERWRPRSGSEPVLDPRRPHRRRPVRQPPASLRPTLACLLPARNAEAELPGWLESVRRFADCVVALDDGSTDRTRELLAADPLVRVLLANPRREGYAGWDDGRNRSRLLEATIDRIAPDWVLFLDADERIDASDAGALVRFLERDAVRGLAYGLRVHRMIGDLTRWDRAGLVAYRLFAPEPGQSLPEVRLHAPPVPRSLPRVETTLRIQHGASIDKAARRARFEKYAACDPAHEHQGSYVNVLEPPGELHEWRDRGPDTPVIAPTGAVARLAKEALDARLPRLSAIVISRNDVDRIESSVRAVVEQKCPAPFEVIVVASGTDGTADLVRERFPSVTVVELPGVALPGAARNAGVRAARGEFVSFPGSHVELPPGSLAARLAAHEAGHAMVTGTTLNGTTTAAGWASYFLDHSGVLPGRPSQRLAGPPAHCSYIRDHLLAVGLFPEDMRAGEDTVVNCELARRGFRAYRARDVRLVHRSPCRNAVRLLRHHFMRGRGFGRILLADASRRGTRPGRPVLRALMRYVPRRLAGTTSNVNRWGGELRPVYRRVLPLVGAGVLAAWAGAAYEVLRAESAGRFQSRGRRLSPSPRTAAPARSVPGSDDRGPSGAA